MGRRAPSGLCSTDLPPSVRETALVAVCKPMGRERHVAAGEVGGAGMAG